MQPEQVIQKAINTVFTHSVCAGRGCSVGIVHSSSGHSWVFSHRSQTNSMVMEAAFADWYFMDTHGSPEKIFVTALTEFLRDAHTLVGGEHVADPGLIAALKIPVSGSEKREVPDDLRTIVIHRDTHRPSLSFQDNVHVLAWGGQHFVDEDAG